MKKPSRRLAAIPQRGMIDKAAAEGIKGREAELKKKGIKVIDKTR